jgi:anti-sigma regulatory factor (Ser/Thr protein kinase)
MNVLGLTAVLIYTFGVYAYGTLLVLWLQDARAGRTTRPDTASWATYQSVFSSGALFAVSFIWFITNLVIGLQQLAPEPPGGWVWSASLWAGLWLALAFPPLITHMVWAESLEARSAPPSLPWGLAVGVMYILSGAVALVSTLGFAGIGVSSQVAGRLASVGTLVLFVGAAIYSMALLARYPAPPRKVRETQSTRWHMAMFGFMALLFALLFGLDRQTSLGALIGGSLDIAARSLPIAFMFVGTYFEHRFEFFDIFVKRGLSLFATMGVLVLMFAAASPVLQRYSDTWAAPWVYAVAFLPFAMALPWLHARIGAMLDRRWLGRRFSTVGAVKHFLSGLRSATTEAQLVAQAEAGLTSIFDAPAAVRLEARLPAAAETLDCVQEVEIVSAEGVAGRFLLGQRRNEAPYFSEDVALLGSLADVFTSVLDNLRLQLREQEQDRRARDLTLQASRSELKALRAQINPHFLFNALNAIAGLIHRDPIVADRTIEKLADVFRYALRGSEAEWTLLDDELEFVRAYLDVEQARFGPRLDAEVQLADNARGARVPTMVIQTLVENAVKHGAATVRGQAIVRIAARRDGDRLVITVEDNGAGFAVPRDDPGEGTARPGGFGLANIRRRLEGYCGTAATLQIERDAERGRTTASIAMPFLTEDLRTDRLAVGSERPR